jgi:hypothetical protein
MPGDRCEIQTHGQRGAIAQITADRRVEIGHFKSADWRRSRTSILTYLASACPASYCARAGLVPAIYAQRSASGSSSQVGIRARLQPRRMSRAPWNS